MRELYRIKISQEDSNDLFQKYIYMRTIESIQPSFSVDAENMLEENFKYLTNLLDLAQRDYNNFLSVCAYKNSNVEDISKYKISVDFDGGYIILK